MSIRDFKQIFSGRCPGCEAKLKQISEEIISCEDNCGFTMASSKFYARCNRKSYGYHIVKQNSRSEEENMLDICQIQ